MRKIITGVICNTLLSIFLFGLVVSDSDASEVVSISTLYDFDSVSPSILNVENKNVINHPQKNNMPKNEFDTLVKSLGDLIYGRKGSVTKLTHSHLSPTHFMLNRALKKKKPGPKVERDVK